MMTAYYNENDPFAAQWLRNLIAAGHIMDGEVDERSIRDVAADDVRGFTRCHFFAGIAGWDYALHLAGWPDDRPVWTGSCPCQPFSVAGKRQGHTDDRHLWPDWFRLIAECRPAIVFGEQVEGAVRHGWLDLVFGDLEKEGYACGAHVLGAHSVGAPHIRQRLWWVATSGGNIGWMADRIGAGLEIEREQQARAERKAVERSGEAGFWFACDWLPCIDGKARPTQPGIFPLAHGVPGRVGQLRAYGNAIVPQVAAAFIESVMECAP